MSAPAQESVPRFVARKPPFPYPGLRPFAKNEWPIFFGREAMADAVLRKLAQQSLLVVHGDSGSGKSSLIYAGVLPVLEQQSSLNSFGWRTCWATPGDQPIANLANALLQLCAPEDRNDEREAQIERALGFGLDAAEEISRLVRRGPEDHICILLDQFEELFAHARQRGPREARQIAEFLIGLYRTQGTGLHAVLTMRSEFLGSCAQFREFAETVNETQYLLPRMKRPDLMRAICEPARLYRFQVEPALAERLIQDAGGTQDELPLIQHGLMHLHRLHILGNAAAATAGTRPTLTLKQYLDGKLDLAGLLSSRASEVARAAEDAVFGTAHSPRVVERIFRALTNINADGHAVRRPQKLAQLVAVSGAEQAQVEAVLSPFRAEGVCFLRPYGDRPLEADDLVDISHEALIRCWTNISGGEEREKGWLMDEFRNGLAWRALLDQARHFRPPEGYLPAAALDEWDRWLGLRNAAWAERYDGGWNEVERFVEASRREVERAAREKKAIADERRRRAEEDQRRAEEDRERAIVERKRALDIVAERTKRVRQLWAAVAVAVVCALVAAVLGVMAFRGQQAALVSESRALESEKKALVSEEQIKKLLTDVEQQRLVLETYKNAATPVQQTVPTGTSDGPPETQTVINNAQQDRIDQALATLAARVYLQISESSQRDAAQDFASRIGKLRLNGKPLIAPGVELQPSKTNDLRCFSTADCAQAEALRQILASELAEPQLTVRNLSGRYKGSTLRAAHYEVWLAPGPIRLKAAAAATIPSAPRSLTVQ